MTVRPIAFAELPLARELVREYAAGHRHVCQPTLPAMAEAVRLYRALGFAQVEPFDPVPGALYLGREL